MVTNSFGVSSLTLQIQALSFVAVGLRLHTRLHIVRQPGWDDAFVAIAALFNLIGQITFLGGTTTFFDWQRAESELTVKQVSRTALVNI
jgi:hypothetical protein